MGKRITWVGKEVLIELHQNQAKLRTYFVEKAIYVLLLYTSYNLAVFIQVSANYN